MPASHRQPQDGGLLFRTEVLLCLIYLLSDTFAQGSTQVSMVGKLCLASAPQILKVKPFPGGSHQRLTRLKQDMSVNWDGENDPKDSLTLSFLNTAGR